MEKYKFTATLEADEGGGAYVLFPYDAAAEFGTQGRIPVKATFDGVPYSGSLVKYSRPQHMLGVLKSIRQRLGKEPGDTIEVVIWKDQEERTLEIPTEFEQLMKREELTTVFAKLSYTHRKEYCRWITEAKRQETREKRMEKAIKMLKDGIRTPG